MGQIPKLKHPIFVALDVDDDETAISLAKKLSEYVGGFKLGPRLTYRYGAKLVRTIAELGPVFVDNKYHDIPQTVLTALKATFESGASFATVHASNGLQALKEFAKLEAELSAKRDFKILCVTVLTSFNAESLPSNWGERSPIRNVLMLANDVKSSSLSGIVCSPEEAREVHKSFPEAFIVTPGIRGKTDAVGDQARVMGPKEAIAAGASALVIGRPIVNAPDPVEAAKNFLTEISG